MARIRDESDPVMARTCDDSLDPWRLVSVMMSSSGSRPVMTPSSDSHIPSGGMQRTGDTQSVGTGGTPDTSTAVDTSIAPDLRTPRTCERQPRTSPLPHPEARTTPKLVHPRPRDLHPQSGPRRSDPPCSRPNLAAPTPGAHIPSHNTSTPTQKETLCSQLSTSA